MSWVVKDLSALVTFLRRKATTFGPVGSDSITFEKLAEGDGLNVARRSDVSARRVFQPMTHYYLRFNDGPNAEPSFADFDRGPRVVIGLRPCDVRALRVQDRVFGESESYRAQRDATAIVGIICSRREPTCFCDSLGGDPLSRDGMDVAAYPVPEGFAIVAVTDRGRALMEGAPFRALETEPEPAFEEGDHPTLDTSGIEESAGRLEDSGVWDDIAFPCVACRVCTYVCPTCHCFTVTDETFGGRAGRAVVWDSCQNKSFTLEASGHNPRAAKAARVRQRLLHKFHFYPSVHGDLMCSGCGRCIAGCPSGRNLVEELELLKARGATAIPGKEGTAAGRPGGGGPSRAAVSGAEGGAEVAEGAGGS